MGRPISAQRHFLITISGVPGQWATARGGDKSVEVTKEYDGGNPRPEALASDPDYEDLVVSRPYRLDRDAPLARELRQWVGRREYTITKQPTDQDYVRQGQPTRYTGVLQAVREPEVEAGSSTGARIELTFAVTHSE